MHVAKGDRVFVRYTGRLDNGDVFDSNEEDELLDFLVGGGDVIDGFERAVVGLAQGETRTFRLEAVDAYGERDEKLVTKLARDLFDADVAPGAHVDLEDEAGESYHADVVRVEDDGVVVDLNHHLAGEALTFDVRIERIERP